MNYFKNETFSLLNGDVVPMLQTMPDKSVNCCVTSPPYWGLRNYGHTDQIGQEPTPEAFVQRLVEVFREVRRVLRDDGTLWLNLGDSYSRQGGATDNKNPARELVHMEGKQTRAMNKPAKGYKPKDLVGIPWMVAFALRADGWYLRQDIIWSKPNPMPESVTDRCTKAHEYIFLLSKSEKYYYDHVAIKTPASASFANDPRHKTGGNTNNDKEGYDEAGAQNPKGPHRLFGKLPGNKSHKSTTAYAEGDEKMRTKAGLVNYCEKVRDNPEHMATANKRSVWTVTTKPYKGAHFATFPPALIEPCILAGCPAGGVVLDPFAGSGTTMEVSRAHGRNSVGIELNPAYCSLILDRLYPHLAGLF